MSWSLRLFATDAKRHQSNESAHHYRHGPSGGRDQQEGDNRQQCSGRKAQSRIDRRLDGTCKKCPHAELVAGMGAERIRSHERSSDLASQLRRKPTLDIDRRQLLHLTLRMRLKFSLLLIEVGSLRVSLRTNGYVFACGHRHGAGDQCRHGGREHKTR